MRITNEVVKYQGKYYARIDYAVDDMIPPKSICKYVGSNTYNNYNMSYSEPIRCIHSDLSMSIYILVQLPEGYVVLKGNDEIGKDTLYYSAKLKTFSGVGKHVFGKYSEICKEYPLWESRLMLNPAKTPQQYFADAEKSGIIDAWKSGKKIEYTTLEGFEWESDSTPNFSLPVKWRVKTLPITPPVFDWRPIVEGQEPKGLVLVMNDIKSKNITTAMFGHFIKEWDDYAGKRIYPTHYTTLE
jgi:hypothetical protein